MGGKRAGEEMISSINKKPAIWRGSCLNPMGGGYFNSTIFLVWTKFPARIWYKYTPALTGLPKSLVAFQITDL